MVTCPDGGQVKPQTKTETLESHGIDRRRANAKSLRPELDKPIQSVNTSQELADRAKVGHGTLAKVEAIKASPHFTPEKTHSLKNDPPRCRVASVRSGN